MMTPKDMKKIQHSNEPKFNIEYGPLTAKKKPISLENKTLTELAKDTHDNLLDDYVMEVSKPDYSVINEQEIKFIMIHCADNFSEIGNALCFDEIYHPEWYNPDLPAPKNDTIIVRMNPYSSHNGVIASQFYDNFEIFVPNMDEIAPENRREDEMGLGITDWIEKKIQEQRKLAEKRWKERREMKTK